MRARKAGIVRGLCVAGLALAGGCLAKEPKASVLHDLSAMRSAVLVEMRPEDRGAFEEGVALATDLKYAEAERKFAGVLGWYQAAGDRERAAETMFWLAFCQEKQGRTEEARAGYQRIRKEYAKTSAFGRATDRLSRLPAPEAPVGPAAGKGSAAPAAPEGTAPSPGRPDEPAPARPDAPALRPAGALSAPARRDAA